MITRWYAPVIGRFLSEDSLLGEPSEHSSRHLYAYSAGEPVGRWDPDGRWWHFVDWKEGKTLRTLARQYLGREWAWPMIWNANRYRWRWSANASTLAGYRTWVYIPTGWIYSSSVRENYERGNDRPVPYQVPSGTGTYKRLTSADRNTLGAAQGAAGIGDRNWAFSFTRFQLYRLIDEATGFFARGSRRTGNGLVFKDRLAVINAQNRNFAGSDRSLYLTDLWIVRNKAPWYCFERPCAVGQYIFLNGYEPTLQRSSHEYIHVLQFEGRGSSFVSGYIYSVFRARDLGPSNDDVPWRASVRGRMTVFIANTSKGQK